MMQDIQTIEYEMQSQMNESDNYNNEEEKANSNSVKLIKREEFHSIKAGNPLTKRKLFTQEEDCLLTKAAYMFHQSSWNDIAKFVPGRTSKQCRDRWTNYLQPSLNFNPWTNQEDKLLISLVNSNGTHWNKIKKCFPGRSTNSLKNRWHWLIKNQNKIDFKLNKLCEKRNEIDKIIDNTNLFFQKNNYHKFNCENNFNRNVIKFNPENSNGDVDSPQFQNFNLQIENQKSLIDSGQNNNLNQNNVKFGEDHKNDFCEKINEIFDRNEISSIICQEFDW